MAKNPVDTAFLISTFAPCVLRRFGNYFFTFHFILCFFSSLSPQAIRFHSNLTAQVLLMRFSSSFSPTLLKSSTLYFLFLFFSLFCCVEYSLTRLLRRVYYEKNKHERLHLTKWQNSSALFARFVPRFNTSSLTSFFLHSRAS